MKILLALFFSSLSFAFKVPSTPSVPGVSDNNISDEQACVPCLLKKMGIHGGGGDSIKNQDSNLSKTELLEGDQGNTKKGNSDINNGNNQPRSPASK